MGKAENDITFTKLLADLTQAKLELDDSFLDREEKQKEFARLKHEFHQFCINRKHSD